MKSEVKIKMEKYYSIHHHPETIKKLLETHKDIKISLEDYAIERGNMYRKCMDEFLVYIKNFPTEERESIEYHVIQFLIKTKYLYQDPRTGELGADTP